MTWMWVSWAENGKSLGVNIVEADDAVSALIKTQELNIAPGSNEWLPVDEDQVCRYGVDVVTHHWELVTDPLRFQCSQCGAETGAARQPHGEHAIFELPPFRDEAGTVSWKPISNRLLGQDDLDMLQLGQSVQAMCHHDDGWEHPSDGSLPCLDGSPNTLRSVSDATI